MSLYHIFQSQTGIFAQSTTGWFSYYVNASGQLLCQPPTTGGGVIPAAFQPNASFALTGVDAAVTFVSGSLNSAVPNAPTGIFYGTTGTNFAARFLGVPTYWIQALGPQGQLLAIPSYTRTS